MGREVEVDGGNWMGLGSTIRNTLHEILNEVIKIRFLKRKIYTKYSF